MRRRCDWCGKDPLYVDYHDSEWGVPLFEDRALFEMIALEGAQAGLNWLTILRKRHHYRQAFDQFDPYKIARYNLEDVQRLLMNAGIVRNRRKIEAVIKNAQGYLQIMEQQESLSQFLWQFVDGVPIQNHWKEPSEIPSQTLSSMQMSKALKSHGFSFVGPTICYALMQSIGMVNDHTTDCFRHQEVADLAIRLA